MRLLGKSNEDLPVSKKKMGFPKIVFKQDLKKIAISKLNKSKSKKRKLICEKCEAKFTTWWNIRAHWESTGHKIPEQCRWCKKKTFTLQSHLCKQHWNLSSMCSYCGQFFMYQEDCEKHQQYHDGTEYRCYCCGKRRKDKEHLKNHMYNHYLYEKYGCNICEKRFKKKKNMEKHLKEIHFVCQYCGNVCNSKVDFRKHLKIHSDLKCLHCQKLFTQKSRLKYHYQLKHGHQDFYRCTLCFCRYVTKSSLLYHLKSVHNGVSNFTCEICEAPFLFWQQYLNHFERNHAEIVDNNKFRCLYCNFKTEIKAKLQWHMEKTSGMGFFCKKCQISLECKGRFDKHMETHVGECVWSCDYCTRSYCSDDTLNHHIARAHSEKILEQNPRCHPCLEQGCDKYYRMKSSLARHKRNAHPESNSGITMHNFCENTFMCRAPLLGTLRKRYKRRKKIFNLKNKLNFVGDESLAHCSSSTNCHMNHSSTAEVNVYYCESCKKVWFNGKDKFQKHMTTHKKKVWQEKCTTCNLALDSPEVAVKHYVEEHLKVQFVPIE